MKNKLAPPFTEAEPDMIYGRGFSQIDDLVRVAEIAGILEKSGSWLSYKGERLGQGKENAAELLALSPEIAHKILADVRMKLLAPEVTK